MIDLKNITITDEFEDKVSSKKKVIAARLGKPEKNEWFKMFNLNGNGYNDYAKVSITNQREERGERQTELLSNDKDPNFATTYGHDLTAKTCRLGYGYTSTGIVFIWPLMFNKDNPDFAWHTSARDIAIEALSEWRQIRANKPNSTNDCYTMPKYLVDKTPDYFKGEIPRPYSWAIETAFRGRIVSTPDHRIIQSIGIKQ